MSVSTVPVVAVDAPTKNKFTPKPVNPLKKHRKSFTLQEKLQIIRRLENGEKASEVAWTYDINESTIRTIKKSADKIKECVDSSDPVSAKVTTLARNNKVQRMEKILMAWVEDQNHKNMPMSTSVIRHQALCIMHQMEECEDNKANATPFLASKGWFDRFRRRHQLKSVPLESESIASNDTVQMPYNPVFKDMVERHGYLPPQAYNNQDPGLVRKKKKKCIRTFIQKEEKAVNRFQLKERSSIEEIVAKSEQQGPDEPISTKKLGEAISLIERTVKRLTATDNNSERATYTSRCMKDGLAAYKELYHYRQMFAKQNSKKKKKKKIKHSPNTTTEPIATTSTNNDNSNFFGGNITTNTQPGPSSSMNNSGNHFFPTLCPPTAPMDDMCSPHYPSELCFSDSPAIFFAIRGANGGT